MAGRSLEVPLYSFAMGRGSGLYFFYFNPPRPAGTPPIFLVGTPRNAAGHGKGRGGLTLLLPLQVFLTPLLVATLLSSPLYFALQNAGVEGNTSFRNEVGYRSFFFAVL